MELNSQVSPEEIMSREVELGCESWTSFTSGCSSTAVQPTGIVLVTLPSTAVETAIAQCSSRWAMARGHRLNTSIVLAAVHGLSSLFRAVSAVEPSLCRPLPPPPPPSPSLKSHLASVHVKQNGPQANWPELRHQPAHTGTAKPPHRPLSRPQHSRPFGYRRTSTKDGMQQLYNPCYHHDWSL